MKNSEKFLEVFISQEVVITRDFHNRLVSAMRALPRRQPITAVVSSSKRSIQIFVATLTENIYHFASA